MSRQESSRCRQEGGSEEIPGKRRRPSGLCRVTLQTALAVSLVFALTGCASVIVHSGNVPFGSPVYCGTFLDAALMKSALTVPDSSPLLLFAGLVDILPSTALDTVCLPIDLVAWLGCGNEKNALKEFAPGFGG